MLTTLPYTASSDRYFAFIRDRNYPVWIDSADLAGWEILSCDPVQVISQKHHSDKAVLYRCRQQTTETLAISALDWLEQQIKEQKPFVEPEAENLPFSGGWIGLLSYEAGQSLDGLRSHYSTKTRVIETDIVFGYYNWAILINHQQQAAYLYHQNAISSSELLKTLYAISAEPHSPSTNNSSFKLISEIHHNTNRDQYSQSFNKIQHYLETGDCYQVNYTQRFEASYQGDAANAYQKLRSHLKAPFSCYFSWDDIQVLSFSPERFIKLQDQQLVSEPIKGTSPRFNNPIEDTQSRYNLKNSVKDQAENLMIVDLLRNDLSRISKPQSVVVDELFGLYSFSNVHHLISRISSKISANRSPVDIIRHCFPGGSITGAPKKRAMEIIDELEFHAREIYCGSIFLFSDNGKVDSNILIRTLLCKNGKLYCWAGGGIVSDSDEETEYQECFTKINAILDALKAASL